MPKLKTKPRNTSHKRTATRVTPAKTHMAARKVPKSKAAGRGATPRAAEPVSSEEEAAFTEALIQSGQAARLDSEGRLPAGATHIIVEDSEGHVKVVRRRFSIA